MFEQTTTRHKVGVWIAGAKGDIASTLMVGTLALDQGLVSEAGLTTALPPMNQLPLAPTDRLVFGGVDINPQPLAAAAESLYQTSRTVSR